MDEGYIGRFRGIPVIIKLDAEITEIVLPESLAIHILELEANKIGYLQKELKSIFPNWHSNQEST
jgi:hypothetical protein